MLWYLLFRLAAFLARRVPERWGTAIVRWVGRVIYAVSPVAENSRDNARHVLGPDADAREVSRVARQAFESRVLNYYDMLRLPALPTEELSARSSIRGMEIVQQILDRKEGAVVVSAHIGPMEFMIQAVVAYGFPMLGITEQLGSERLHEYVTGLRASHGLTLISTQAPLLDVYRRVKRGEVLLSTADRDSTGTGQVVELFGAPAWLPDGYARLAVRAGVPVVFGYCQRTSNGARGQVFPAIYPDPALEKQEAVRDVMRRTARCLEQAIQHDPAEWHLSAPIWTLARERQAEGQEARSESARSESRGSESRPPGSQGSESRRPRSPGAKTQR